MQKESQFQSGIIKELYKLYPGCIVLKTDPNYKQGIPDLIVLYGKTWLALEVKRSAKASHRPNQDYYINKMNNMSYASFIYPENRQIIFSQIAKHFTK